MLRRIYKASVDIVLCAPNKKGKKTETLIAPTNQRLRGARTQQKKTLGLMSGKINQRRPRTSNNDPAPPLPAALVSTASVAGHRRYLCLHSPPSSGMYSSETRPSPTGNKASHLTQLNLLPFGTSIVTIMYFAPQLGQAKAIGSDLLLRQCAGICAQ